MKTLFFAMSLFVIGLQASLYAAESSGDLSEEIAKRLISDVLNIAENGINVATVVDGSKRAADGFEENKVRRVTVIHPVLEEGRLIRRVRCYDFSWNPKYGWFYRENHSSRGGEELLIWSELLGELVVK
jgi:hypothetical protein